MRLTKEHKIINGEKGTGYRCPICDAFRTNPYCDCDIDYLESELEKANDKIASLEEKLKENQPKPPNCENCNLKLSCDYRNKKWPCHDFQSIVEALKVEVDKIRPKSDQNDELERRMHEILINSDNNHQAVTKLLELYKSKVANLNEKVVLKLKEFKAELKYEEGEIQPLTTVLDNLISEYESEVKQ